MNIVSRITQQAASGLFTRILTVKTIHKNSIHSLYNKLTSSIEENERRNSFLQPKLLPLLQQFCGMKYKTRLRLRCKGCYFVTRQETLYVMCKLKPRHKQSVIKKKEEHTWMWTSITQKRVRDW